LQKRQASLRARQMGTRERHLEACGGTRDLNGRCRQGRDIDRKRQTRRTLRDGMQALIDAGTAKAAFPLPPTPGDNGAGFRRPR
jgi:hypothetical protein